VLTELVITAYASPSTGAPVRERFPMTSMAMPYLHNITHVASSIGFSALAKVILEKNK
jgi:hypothetical protein